MNDGPYDTGGGRGGPRRRTAIRQVIEPVEYVIDITLSLVRVLERAAFLRDERLAGYAANGLFWANEVRHALDVIAGYELGVRKWRQAVPSDSSRAANDATRSEDLAKLGERLKAAATRFFRLCHRYLDRSQVIEIEQLLVIRIEPVGLD